MVSLGIAIAVLNLPFGYWRANTVKLSRQWFLAVHLPVPMVILLRLWFGFGWSAVPFFVACFALGQWVGGKVQQAPWLRDSAQKTSCLFMDLFRLFCSKPAS